MEYEKTTIAELMRRARRKRSPRTKGQAEKRQTRYDYTQGPMHYLGQQIVRGMQDAGYPAKIHVCYRPPDLQDSLYRRGRSKAKAWQSPHQYFEAVDVVHETLFWECEQDFWDTLARVVKIVAEKYNVTLEHGYDWGWDSAHIELKDFRKVRNRQGRRVPDALQLAYRFEEVLPDVWKQATRNGLPDVVSNALAAKMADETIKKRGQA